MREEWILRIESRLRIPLEKDDTYVLVTGNGPELWSLFQRWSNRFEELGETLTAASVYLCQEEGMTKTERLVREASVKADTYEDFVWLRDRVTRGPV